MKLAIISHTEHYQLPDGTILGWGPTVREINHLVDIFEEIYHIAMLSSESPPQSALKYDSENIHFIPIPMVGGKDYKSKASIFLKAPTTVKTVTDILKKVDCFQFRAPTGIGVYLIPYLSLFSKKKGWFKYAGNWNQVNPPFGYALQKFFLKNQKRKVTINGSWPNQPSHCLSFENPCLTQKNLEDGAEVCKSKDYSGKLKLCFVGRLEEEKGVGIIIDSLKSLDKSFQENIESVSFVGEGPMKIDFKRRVENLPIPTKFLGSLSNQGVFKIFEKSHFLLLPTLASEGFPKVLAEAINFGCIPVVTDISSITQYIKHRNNGFVLSKNNTERDLSDIIKELAVIKREELNTYLLNRQQLVDKFTFTYYNSRILNEIIGTNN